MIQMAKCSIPIINTIYKLPFLFLGLIACNSQNAISLQKRVFVCLYLSRLCIIRISITYFRVLKVSMHCAFYAGDPPSGSRCYERLSTWMFLSLARPFQGNIDSVTSRHHSLLLPPFVLLTRSMCPTVSCLATRNLCHFIETKKKMQVCIFFC